MGLARSIAALLVTVTALSLGGCAQARRGIGAGGIADLWQPLELCQNESGFETLACVDIQLNVTSNSAYIDVKALGFDAGQYGWRVLARMEGRTSFNLLADGITEGEGATVEVRAPKNTRIEKFEEWIIETAQAVDDNGFLVAAPPFQGIQAARALMKWSERQDQIAQEGSN